ncbi:MAG: acetyltransferase, partial [Clostridium sp.]
YSIVGGNPAKIISKRFDESLINHLLEIKWWDWSKEKIFSNLEVLCSSDLEAIKNIK